MKWFAFVASLTFMFSVFVLTGSLHSFFDLYSLLLVLVMSCLALLGRHGKYLFNKETLRDKRKEILSTVIWASLFSACLGFIVGLVAIFAANDVDRFSPAFAVALLPLLYGVLQAFLAFVLIEV